MALHRGCEASRRLAEIPGIGPVGATALVAEIGDWKTFSSGRSLAAWIGLVPKQHTTGGRDRLGSITKQGNRYLRWLLVVGAMAVIRYARKHGTEKRPWLGRLMELTKNGNHGGFTGTVTRTAGATVFNLYADPQEENSIGIRHIPIGISILGKLARYQAVLKKYPPQIQIGFQ
jgi:hypothetical protein